MLDRAKRASHIDPPTSSYAIMRRACPYRGENPEPGKDFHAELDPKPGIREQPGSSTDFRLWHPAPEPGGQNSVGFGRKADEATQRASEPFVTQMRLL